jgi:hypothetical protein
MGKAQRTHHIAKARRFHRDPCVAHIAPWIIKQGAELEPDRGQAEAFLNCLDVDKERFSFRTFSDTPYTRSAGHDPLEKALHGSLSNHWKELVELNREGAAITITINRSNGKGRGNRDIRRVRALFIDDDQRGDARRLSVLPHIQVQTSPNHYHYYWLVKDLPLHLFTPYQRHLAHRYHGDSRVQALNQAMQLPGFWRRKRLSHPRFPKLLRIVDEPPLDDRRIEMLLGPMD